MLAIISALLTLAPRLIDAGIELGDLWTKMRDGLDAVPEAERDAQWDEADAGVNELKARAFDPKTDQPPQ